MYKTDATSLIMQGKRKFVMHTILE